MNVDELIERITANWKAYEAFVDQLYEMLVDDPNAAEVSMGLKMRCIEIVIQNNLWQMEKMNNDQD